MYISFLSKSNVESFFQVKYNNMFTHMNYMPTIHIKYYKKKNPNNVYSCNIVIAFKLAKETNLAF